MRIILPAVLIAAIPLVVILWRYLRSDLRVMVLRTAILLCLALAMAGLSFRRGEPGSDLLVVADRSLSLPAETLQKQEEIVQALAQRRGSGDRLGLVVFGRGAHLAGKPAATGSPSVGQAAVDAEASDLAGGIRLAVSAVPRHRPARLLVLSDGLFTGSSPLPAAFEALERDVPIDFRFLGRKPGPDIAVEDLLLPGEVPLGTPFQVKLPVFAEKAARAEVVLRRGTQLVARKTVQLEKGLNQVFFRDLPRAPGILTYRAEAAVEGDPIPDNNRALGAVEVVAPKRLLLINQEGRKGNLARALEAGSLPVDVRGPDGLPASLVRLVPYRVVILENVPATKLPGGALGKLARFVTELGGGLLLSGGRASFGVGGYYLSRIDPILPVSMELKEEHRALSVAMVIALDRSGSMQAPTPDGMRKMDLANLGACAAIELLSPLDQVAVLAVDSLAHLIVDLTEVNDPGDLVSRVRGIESMGGGIMTDTAMEHAAALLARTDRSTRHLVLFADAADAEEATAGRCVELVEDLKNLGATVSVIGLGSEHDADAGLLKRIAERTSGRVYFSDKASDLPQLFAMETITVARSSFIEEATGTEVLPDINLLGELYGRRPLPQLDGYNMTYLKAGASCGIRATDAYQGPVVAFWSRGLGRVAAVTAQADGDWGRTFLTWPHYGDFFVTLMRYLQGEGAPGFYVASRRHGTEGVVTVEVDPEDPASLTRLKGAQLLALAEDGMS
ncbi:MAG: VWA domain-containing protein, partial [Gemmatimonadota bacterium]